MRPLFIFLLVLGFCSSLSAISKDIACDWAFETMNFSKIDDLQAEFDSQGRLVVMSMFDTLEVEKGSACSSGGGSVCTVMAIIHKGSGRVRMAHLAGKQPFQAERFIKEALTAFGGPEEAKNIQVVMAGNQTAAAKIDEDYEEEYRRSEVYEQAIRKHLTEGGVAPTQIKSFLSSQPESYAYDLTVDTENKRIYLARKKVRLIPNDPKLLQRH